MTTPHNCAFANFQPDTLTTHDFLRVGLPAFAANAGSLENSENFFHENSGISAEFFGYHTDEETFTVAKLFRNGTQISNAEFEKESFRTVLGIRQDYQAITLGPSAGVLEEVTTVTPGAKNIIAIAGYLLGIYLRYDINSRTELPTNIHERVIALAAEILSI